MTEPSAPGWRRAVAPLLLASLMVNMFLIGGVVGDHFAPGPPPAPPPVEHAPSERVLAERAPSEPAAARARAAATPFRDAIAQLPAEERRAVNQGFAQRRQETRAARDRVIAARGRARELMAAEPLDATALSTALAEMRAASTALQNITHTVLLETAPLLAAESRRKLADALRAQ
jgi:uncharacterized membrane protein